MPAVPNIHWCSHIFHNSKVLDFISVWFCKRRPDQVLSEYTVLYSTCTYFSEQSCVISEFSQSLNFGFSLDVSHDHHFTRNKF